MLAYSNTHMRLYSNMSGTDKNESNKNESKGKTKTTAERMRMERRERIAAMCLQGLLANPNQERMDLSMSERIEFSVQYADELLAALDE